MALQPAETTMMSFCKALPKVELHAHLNGSLSERTVHKLACLDIPIVQYLSVVNTMKIKKREEVLEDCFALFRIAHSFTSTPQAVYIATKEVIQDFASDNVMYLELRTTPRCEEHMTRQQYVESVIKAIKENKEDITVKLILSIDRSHHVKDSQYSLNDILKMKEKYPDIIKGIDFSGNPKIGGFESEIFKTAKGYGLFTAIHCAEVKNDEEVKQILNFDPDRLGHATFLHPDHGGCQENWELYCKKKIPVELCLTSNVICNTSKSYEEHHLQQWIKNDLPFSVSTDDKGVFSTSLSKEYFIAHKYYNLTTKDLWKMALNSMNYSFASDAEKLHLRTKLSEWRRANGHLF